MTIMHIVQMPIVFDGRMAAVRAVDVWMTRVGVVRASRRVEIHDFIVSQRPNR